MEYVTVDCPRCGAAHQYLLSRTAARHLRQCPECDDWFVRAAAEDRTDSLGDPPTCPVAGCGETVPTPDLPAHVIERRDGELGPPA